MPVRGSFFQLFDYSINNVYLLYKHNCKLFDMPPKDLLNFHADLVNLLIHRSRYIESDQWSLEVRVIPEMVFQVVPSVELEKLVYRKDSVATAWMWADVQFITPPLPALFVKFISARFPVLQTITRTEL